MRRWLVAAALLAAAAADDDPPAFGFAPTLGHYAVLQRGPAKAAVYGPTAAGGRGVAVTVTVRDSFGAGETETVRAELLAGGTLWKALLRPREAGGDYSVTASCAGCGEATLRHVTFGDVWLSVGQSNMALQLRHTFTRNRTVRAFRSGRFDNVRTLTGDSAILFLAKDSSWKTAALTVRGDCEHAPGGVMSEECPLLNTPALPTYFAQSLTVQMRAAGMKPPPLGMVNMAIGGSQLSDWAPRSVIGRCRGVPLNEATQAKWDERIEPYLHMTIKGWLWYQGENNVRSAAGNSAMRTGYGCLFTELVHEYRRRWSATPGTTDPLAPFGVVTLAAGTDEGGEDIGGLRWAQTGNHGVLPNPALPGTFLAQAYDLGDPYPEGESCISEWKCCRGYDPAGTDTRPGCAADAWSRCAGFCSGARWSASKTAPFMAPDIHPRNKLGIARRLAQAALNTVYGGAGVATGPTLAGCSVRGDELMLRFNETLLGADTVAVGEYGAPSTASAARVWSNMEVLVDGRYWCREESLFCAEPSSVARGCERWEYRCDDPGAPRGGECGGPLECGKGAVHGSGVKRDGGWVSVDVREGRGASEVIVDLSPLRGAVPLAVRYAWHNTRGGSCCAKEEGVGLQYPCAPGSCPLRGQPSGLPANPFMALVSGGRCQCIPPQVCDDVRSLRGRLRARRR